MKHICQFSQLNIDNDVCEICILAKHHALPFPKSLSIASSLLELVHMDVWGPYKSPTYTGAKYFVSILDDHSRAVWIQLIKTKDQVAGVVKDFLILVENQFGSKSRRLELIMEQNLYRRSVQSCLFQEV